ncbi:uncharacterized protein CTRU02_215518 [Colletotrichum truncatum]|uniref:Uncharacterized protein n=1 Tax=Colletotrichum truncatum TaxID=5467 RepID=A0ACC3YCN6_COLTU|nr:uncharacterized protein CTRU02_05537 [Colletotrichum truncatum]KAF6793980.1 hypothetical protein CTRU02_05537 [Colletotrichum truncatum]
MMECKMVVPSQDIVTFARLKRLYPTFTVASAVSGCAAIVMLLDKSPAIPSILHSLSTCLIVSSAVTAAFTATTAIMLSLTFQENHKPTRMCLALVWTPVFFFDCMIIQLVLGLALWFVAGHSWQYSIVLGLLSGFSFSATLVIAVLIRKNIKETHENLIDEIVPEK